MIIRILAIAVVTLLTVLPAAAQTPESAAREAPLAKPTSTVYGHIGRGSDELTGGLGVLWAGPQGVALGLDLAVEGSQDDETYGRASVESAYSFNLLVGFSGLPLGAVQIVPFALIGARTYKTTCPTGDSYLGFRCYADYEPETHYKLNYGGGAVLQFSRLSVGVRATGESVAVILGYNW